MKNGGYGDSEAAGWDKCGNDVCGGREVAGGDEGSQESQDVGGSSSGEADDQDAAGRVRDRAREAGGRSPPASAALRGRRGRRRGAREAGAPPSAPAANFI